MPWSGEPFRNEIPASGARGQEPSCRGLDWDTGKENGNYYLGFRVYALAFRVWGCVVRLAASFRGFYKLGYSLQVFLIIMDQTRKFTFL